MIKIALMAMAMPIAAPLSADVEAPELASVDLRADFDELIDWIEQTHPGLGYVADRSKLADQIRTIRNEIDHPMNVREAWLLLARLNPYFADAHTGLRHPNSEFETYRKNGGAVFPLPVIVDREGRLRVAAGIPEDAGVRPFERIASINGHPAEEIISHLMIRMRGETESLRRLVLAFNFPAYLWTLEGPAESYRIEVVDDQGERRQMLLDAVPQPTLIPSPTLSFPRPDIALLRVPSFDPSLRDEFSNFMEQSIAAIERQDAHILLIDIRDNPGGAHDVSDQLVAWLTDRSVTPSSALTARITEDNRDISPEAAVGSVVTVPYDEQVAPREDGKRFDGEVYVLISEDSYSQAIVFAATIKDHDLGMLVGEETGGAANQTGQITLQPLEHSGLQALAPLYIIYRPSGDRTRSGLLPDIPLAHDPTRPMEMVERLLAMLPQ